MPNDAPPQDTLTGPQDGIAVYTTCPASPSVPEDEYLSRASDVMRWSERSGCTGFLIYSDNDNVDPWLLAQLAMLHTERSVPLVAVQPIAMHPHSVAKMITTLGQLHQRPVHVNLVSGGFVKHLESLDDHLPHDTRYTRLVEYARIVQGLLGNTTYSHSGDHFSVRNAHFSRPLRPDLAPRYFVSGSSPAAARAARDLGVHRLAYPRPVHDYEAGEPCPEGIRIGVLARPDSAEAWRTATTRFPHSETGRLIHEMAVEVSDSHWHGHLAARETAHTGTDTPYWLHPFRNYNTFCPYLVGSYQEVGTYLSRYLALGVRTLVLDVPAEEDDLHHTHRALAEARQLTP